MYVEKLGRLSESQIKQLEEELSVTLPEDYCEFLKTTNGVISKDDTQVYISDLDSKVEIDSLFGVQPEKKWLDICHTTSLFDEDLPEGSILFGRDLLGGFFVLICGEDLSGVYYWDDKFNFEKSNEDSNAYFLTENFDAFLELLGGTQE